MALIAQRKTNMNYRRRRFIPAGLRSVPLMSSRMKITQYLSGAFFANGIRIVIAFVLSPYLQAAFTLFQILGSWTMTIFAGAVPSYLLTKGMKERHMLTGAIIGLYSYIIYVLLTFLGVTSQVEEMWVFLGFLLGGFLGGRLGEKGKIQLGKGLPGAPDDQINQD